MSLVFDVMYQTRNTVSFLVSKDREDNTTQSGVILTKFEVFGNVVKHLIECLLYFLDQKPKLKF